MAGTATLPTQASSAVATPVSGKVVVFADTDADALGVLAVKRSDGSVASVVESVGVTAPITSTGGATPTIGISAATDSLPGSMSAADKTKLDSMTAGAAVASVGVTAPVTNSGTSTAPNINVTTSPGSASAVVGTGRNVNTTAPLTGGGTLASDLTLAISAATDSNAGSMSAADKTKLDGITSGAAVASVGATLPITSTGGTTPTIAINAATDTTAGSMSASDKTKLDGMTAGAAVASVTGTAPIVSSGGTAPVISISAATDSTAGSLSAADKTKLDSMTAGAAVASVVVTAPVTNTGTATAPVLALSGILGTNTALAPTGLTGATTASRYVGGTASGAPTSGTFAVGDFVVAVNGQIWICTVAGTPGTWISSPDINIFRPGDYANGNTYDPTGVSDSTTSFTAMMTAFNAAGATKRGIIVIPPGVFIVQTGVLNFTQTTPCAIIGSDRGTTVLVPAASTPTGDMIKFASGTDGCSVQNLALYQTGTPQTAGNLINTNGANDLLISNVLFVGGFNDVYVNGSSIKVNITHTYHSETNGSANSVGILITNGSAGDTYIGPDVVMSNTGATRRRACVEVTQTGHFELNQCNLTGANQGLLVDPGAGLTVSYGFVNCCLFDSCLVNGMTLNASTTTSVIQSLHFVNSWFSGTNAGGGSGAAGVLTAGVAGGILDGIVFTACRFFNNETHGFQHGFGTDFEFASCQMRGNSQVGSGTDHGLSIAAAVSNFRVIGGKYGGSVNAATGGNQGYGISIAAGASTLFSIIGADLSGNVTGPLSNGASGTFCVQGCVGLPTCPGGTAPATLLAATTTYVTPSFSFPAGSLQVGSTYVCDLDVTSVATASTATILIKWGTAGTTADQSLQSFALGAGTAAIGTARIRVKVVCKAIGATTTFMTSIEVYNYDSTTPNNTTGVTNIAVQLQVVASVNATSLSSAANFLGVAITETVASAHTVASTAWTRLGDRQ